MSDSNIPAGAVDPAEFARSVASTPDEQLGEGMSSEMRGMILSEIFRRMEEHFEPSKSGATDAVVHWNIGAPPEGASDRFEIVIRGGACKVSSEPSETARVTLSIGSVDFLKLVTANATGPELFMAGKLRIEGDMMFAATVASLFRIPDAQAPA